MPPPRSDLRRELRRTRRLRRQRLQVAAGDRRQRQQPRAAVLHLGHEQRRARRSGQSRHHGEEGEPGQLQLLVRPVRVHLGPAQHGREVHHPVRARRGPHEAPARPGHLARLLDARQRHGQHRLARRGRDRHHGERRLRAGHRARHAPRAGLLRLRRYRRGIHPAGRRGLRGRLPHLRHRLEPQLHQMVGGRERLPDLHSPTSAAGSGSSTSPSS